MKPRPSMKKSVLISLLYFLSIHCYSQCEESYQALWGLNDGSSITVSHATFTAQNDLLVCGSSNAKGIIVHFKKTSGIQWAKRFAFGTNVNFRRILAMSDGGITAAGSVTENGTSSLLIVRLNGLGEIIWTKRLHDISAVPGLTNLYLLLEGLGETPDGGIAVCGRKYYQRNSDGYNNYRAFVFKLSAAGDVDWTREDTKGNDDERFALLIDNGSIVMVGTTYSVGTGIRYGFLEKLNPANGTVEMFKLYQLGTLGSNFFRSIEKSGSDYEIGTQAFAFGARVYNVLRVNSSGDPLECKKLPPIGPQLIDQYYYPVPLSDGSSMVWPDWFYSSTEAQLAKINADRTSAWNYEYTMAGLQKISKVLPDGSNAALAVGYSPDPGNPNGSQRIYLLKVKPDGATDGCVSNPLNMTVKDSLSYLVSKGDWQTTALNFQAPYSAALSSENVQFTSTILCKGSSCRIDNLAILGEKVICTPGTTRTYTARMSGTCAVPVQWTLDAAIGSLERVNDSMVRIYFTNPGTATLKANVDISCATYTESILLHYSPLTDMINLGADTTICKGDTLFLSVNSNYNYTQWMDGSIKNSRPVVSSGVYSVSVSNDGVCFVRDTILVGIYNSPVVQLSKDSVLCLPEPITLRPGNGFASYQWQDGSGMPTFTVQQLGTYWVRVTDKNGCTFSDTAAITKLGQRPSDFIRFADTAICFGEKVALKVNGDFVTYNWNDGESFAPVYTTGSPGIYDIRVRNEDGCTGNETVVVHDKGCVQAVYIPNAFTPNGDGSNDLFKATAFGVLDYFDLQVYNRWGELVFKTNDVKQGWNGVYRQRLQPSDTFVWYVRYRFGGSTSFQLQKGTTVLIR
jgi:gliding motility-associated-like protein